jgi:hypothetical protein
MILGMEASPKRRRGRPGLVPGERSVLLPGLKVPVSQNQTFRDTAAKSGLTVSQAMRVAIHEFIQRRDQGVAA